jgi:predicted peptidase
LKGKRVNDDRKGAAGRRWSFGALALGAMFAASCRASDAHVDVTSTGPSVRSERRMSDHGASRRYGYLAWTPVGAAPRDGWPLLLFLHGAGERGDDLARVEVHGPPKLVASTPALWGCVLVAPQCPDGEWWSTDALLALIEEVRATERIDARRVYVSGLSMGGFGTFELVATRPDLFAAALPICGGLRGEREAAIAAAKDVPMRVFHGADDKVVPPESSVRLVERLRALGADVELTLYPGVAHDSWTRTYADPTVLTWLFQQRRGRTPAR